MPEDGWVQWATVLAGDRVWMGGRPEHGGGWYVVDADPVQCPPEWADEPVLWAVVAGHGLQVRPAERVWCSPATYRPDRDTDAAFHAAIKLVQGRAGGVQVGGYSERRG